MEKTIEKQGEEEGEKKKSFEIPEKGKVEEDREPTKLLLTQEEVNFLDKFRYFPINNFVFISGALLWRRNRSRWHRRR